jgi:hypothetical protein
MSKLDLFTGSNMGGITHVYYCSKQDIQSISDPDQSGQVTLTFKEGCSWNEIVSSLETTHFQEKSVDSFAGIHFEKELSFFIPKDREETVLLLHDLYLGLFICRCRDSNGKFKIIGELSAPLQFDFTVSVPAETKNPNGIRCAFSGKGPRISFFDSNQQEAESGSVL